MDIIYQITDTITQLKYIGSKKNWKGPNTYWGSPNCKSKNNKKYYLQQEWLQNIKDRPETFLFEILESFETIDHRELINIEFSYHKKFNVVKDLQYINAGYAKQGFCGDTMCNLTPEARYNRIEKIKTTLHNKLQNMSKEEKSAKWGKKGELNSNYNNRWSAEQKEHMSKKMKIIVNTPEYKEKHKIAMSNVIYHYPYSYRDRTGKNNSFYGKHHTEKTKKIISEKAKGRKPINTKYISIENIIYYGLTEATNKTGIKSTTIWHRIHSKNIKYKEYFYVTYDIDKDIYIPLSN